MKYNTSHAFKIQDSLIQDSGFPYSGFKIPLFKIPLFKIQDCRITSPLRKPLRF